MPVNQDREETFTLLMNTLTSLQTGQDAMHLEMTESFKAMNGRVRRNERDITRIKTVLGIAGAIFGVVATFITTNWAGFKAWLTATSFGR
jgi:hypothetical protein